MSIKNLVISFCLGVVFGFGLVLSGMADPEKVLAFLTIDANWSYLLLIVMSVALLVYATGYFVFVKRIQKPIYGTEYNLPSGKKIDKNLVSGAVLFGIGWGLVGICPGPAVMNLAVFDPNLLVFFGAMLLGMKITGNRKV